MRIHIQEPIVCIHMPLNTFNYITMKIILFLVMTLLSLSLYSQNFYTKYEHSYSNNEKVIIENSFPKGGFIHTTIAGKEYSYVVFWSRITNNTNYDLELHIDASHQTFKIPASPRVGFKMFFPKNFEQYGRQNLQDYGFNVKEFLDSNIHKPSFFTEIIKAGDSHGLYSVVLSDNGVSGVMRAGLVIGGKDLIYKVNGLKLCVGYLTPNL